jgi:FkbM family methyltransferase
VSLSSVFGRLWAALPEPTKRVYRRVPVSIRYFLYDRLLTGKITVTIRGGLACSMRMEVLPRTEMGFYLGNYEADVQDALTKFAKPGMTVFNIGANVGFFSLGLARLVGSNGRVVAFEPNPAALERLKVNVALNNLQDVISAEPIAAGDFDGNASFALARTEMQGRFSDLPHVSKDAAVVSVTCTTIDTYTNRTGIVPDLLLIDVEHAEGRVLRGMRRLLQKQKPVIIIELHGQQAIAEAYQELIEQEYGLFSTNGLNPIDSIADIRMLGHYVALPVTPPVGRSGNQERTPSKNKFLL